jgi:hypothetical protein
MNDVERRLFRTGTWLIAAGAVVTFVFFGAVRGFSFIAGGLLALLSLAWLRQTVGVIVFTERGRSVSRVIAGYLLRLVLIPLSFYAMVKFLSLSIVAAVAGFAVFNASILAEGLYEALKSSSKENA